MKNFLLRSCLFLSVFSLMGFIHFQVFALKETDVDKAINKMTDEEKIAQLFVVAVYSLNSVKEIFDVFIPGGFTFQARIGDDKTHKSNKSVRNVIEWLNYFQKISLEKYGFVSLVMVDQEGGTVSRFSRKRHKAFRGSRFFDVVTPYMMRKTGEEFLAYNVGFAVGEVLRSLGFNINMAPVVDVTDVTQKKSFMKQRSFGFDPQVVKRFSRAYERGLNKAGVTGVFKHFPGYGNASADTHSSRSVIYTSKKNLIKRDLVPYERNGEKGDPKAVMINIALYPDLDRQNTAPLSSKIVTKLLKEELKFKGLIMSDSLSMEGFIEKDFAQRAVKALTAGNDLILVDADKSSELIRAYHAVLKAFRKGVLKQDRVHESLRKILSFKSSLFVVQDQPIADRLKLFNQSMERLYAANSRVLSYNLSSYFEGFLKKKVLPQGQNLIVFSNRFFYKNLEPYLEQWKYFKSRRFFPVSVFKKGLSAKKQKAQAVKWLKKTDFISICYGDAVRFCDTLPDDLKAKIIVIHSKPYEKLDFEKYWMVVPVYGPALESGPLVLGRMIFGRKHEQVDEGNRI